MASLATPIGVVRADTTAGTFAVVGWDGKPLSFSGTLGTDGASLSTDGKWVATSSTEMMLTGSPVAGSQQLHTATAGYPGEAGWIDASHMVYRIANSSKGAIYNVTSRSSTPLSIDGTLVGRIPGGL